MTIKVSTRVSRVPKVYLAGPEVFLDNALEVGQQKKAICAANGLEGLFPLDKEINGANKSPEDLAQAIYEANIGLMLRADLLIANITPFRGPSMDVGTAFEIGFCAARKLPVFAYANVSASLTTRVLVEEARPAPAPSRLLDSDGMEIENFGFFENLMIEVPVRLSGGGVIAVDVPPGERFTNLSNFERAVRRAAEAVGSGSRGLLRSRIHS
jgi:nucleoside 2-deoxyribosyltransferase